MENRTKELWQAYVENVIDANGVPSNGLNFSNFKFNVDPQIQRTLENIMHENAGFLKRINIHTVRRQEGEKIGLDINNTIASTTNTLVQARQPQDPTDLTLIDNYRCEQTNFDTVLRYAKVDQWAEFDDFEERISNHIMRQIARDRLMIMWNGTSRAATSDRAANPLLQDVNIGVLEKLRLMASQRILTEGKNTDEIRIGQIRNADGTYDKGDYLNIDALVMDMVNNLIEEWYQEDTGLVVIIGRKIFNHKFFDLVNNFDEPTERNALDIILANKKVGGMPAIRVPFFPANGIMITRLDNLSIYSQADTMRRTIVDRAEWDRIENYTSVNEAYVVEDYGMTAYAEGENILVPQADGSWG